MKELEIIRSITRSLAFLLPLLTLCAALFVLPEYGDTICGALVGSCATAGIFYFKKDEE